jgi:hypothetical protein
MKRISWKRLLLYFLNPVQWLQMGILCWALSFLMEWDWPILAVGFLVQWAISLDRITHRWTRAVKRMEPSNNMLDFAQYLNEESLHDEGYVQIPGGRS